VFVLAVRLAKKAGGRLAAWWAGVFLALSPFLVHYAHEIRMYGLLALFLVAATHAAWRINGLDGRPPKGDDGSIPRLVPVLQFALTSALAMYTHTLAVFYLAPLALLPFWLPALRRSLQPGPLPRRRERTRQIGFGYDDRRADARFAQEH
jgi:4-amino-4-deoxy-L-arabinose transferase-like glycosyltransferase